MFQIVTTRCIVFMVHVRQCVQFAHKDEGGHECRDKYDANENMEAHPRKANCSSVVLKTLGGRVVEQDDVAEVTSSW